MITDKIIKNTFVTYGLYPKGIFGLIYFVGLNYVGFQAFFTPATKISWRIFSKFWGNGYAAKNPLTYEFEACSLQKIVSFFTALKNLRSILVIKK